MRRTYAFNRTCKGVKEWGITSADSPDEAMQHVLGSHPTHFGVTYAFVYLPDVQDDPNSDYSREWTPQ
jgi:hypothetical protein